MTTVQTRVNIYSNGRIAGIIRPQVERNALLPKVRRVQALAKSYAPVRTGALRASIYTRARSSGGQFASLGGTNIATYEIVAAAPYSRYVEEGTRPHVITVKNARVLTDGVNFFGQKVNHPGTRPRKFMARALIAGMR